MAHVPLPLRVEVGCAGGVPCDDLTVTARELRDDGPPVAAGLGRSPTSKDGKAALDLTITLERAGARIVEVAIAPPPGDTIPENDRRLVTFDVARERVRVLHVAGRPTNDVRALRQWLKSDASVDVVAFFILRTPTDDVRATQNELALIPFPVDELFTEHLPSFDAIVLQDFDAQPYGLEKYLPNVERYVRGGGGLVMVGGQNSFVAGRLRGDAAGLGAARGARRRRRGRPARTRRRSCRSGRPRDARRRCSRCCATSWATTLPPMPGANVARRRAPGRRRALVAPDAHDEERREDAGPRRGGGGRRADHRDGRRRGVGARSSRRSGRARRAGVTARSGTGCSAG